MFHDRIAGNHQRYLFTGRRPDLPHDRSLQDSQAVRMIHTVLHAGNYICAIRPLGVPDPYGTKFFPVGQIICPDHDRRCPEIHGSAGTAASRLHRQPVYPGSQDLSPGFCRDDDFLHPVSFCPAGQDIPLPVLIPDPDTAFAAGAVAAAGGAEPPAGLPQDIEQTVFCRGGDCTGICS